MDGRLAFCHFKISRNTIPNSTFFLPNSAFVSKVNSFHQLSFSHFRIHAPLMSSEGELSSPSLPWRFGSTLTFGAVGALCKSFLNVACTTRVHGLDEFQKLLDERRDVSKRERGLITGIIFNPIVLEYI